MMPFKPPPKNWRDDVALLLIGVPHFCAGVLVGVLLTTMLGGSPNKYIQSSLIYLDGLITTQRVVWQGDNCAPRTARLPCADNNICPCPDPEELRDA